MPLAGVLVLDRHRQRLPCPDEDSEVFGPGQAVVPQVPEEHLEMPGEDRNDYRSEFASL